MNSKMIHHRENILQKLPDLVYGVYKLINADDHGYELALQEDILTTYKNIYEDNKNDIDFGDITLIDLGALRKGKVEVLYGDKNLENDNFVLLSSGVVEYIEKNGTMHLITTLRDGGGFDSLQFTTTAGRCVGEDLVYEIEREHYEEGPFLGKNTAGEYCLAIPAGNPKGKEYTKQSIEHFLHHKYTLTRDDVLEEVFLELFEIVFPGVDYDNLGKILRDISDNDRFVYYNWEKGHILEIEDDIKKITIGGKTYEYYVYFDKENNTIEYRDIRKIVSFPEEYIPLDPERPGKLFLESRYQFPREPHIENAYKFAVPTISKISLTIKEKKIQ